jgi:hypothetical protein
MPKATVISARPVLISSFDTAPSACAIDKVAGHV